MSTAAFDLFRIGGACCVTGLLLVIVGLIACARDGASPSVRG